jgi:hypothetical protein
MMRAWEQKELAENFDLLGEIDSIITKTKDIFQRNYDKGNDPVALLAVREQRCTLELLCRISVHLHEMKLLENEDNEEQNRSQENAEFDESIKILNNAELEIFFQLTQKILEQDSGMVVIPDEPSEFDLNDKKPTSNTNILIKRDTTLKRTKPPENTVIPDIQEEDIDGDDIDNGFGKDLKVRPIPEIEAPITRWKDHPLNPRRGKSIL